MLASVKNTLFSIVALCNLKTLDGFYCSLNKDVIAEIDVVLLIQNICPMSNSFLRKITDYILCRMEIRQWQYALLLFLALIWGSSFILMKRGLESFSSNQVAALRIFLTFIFFLPFIFRQIKKLNRNNFWPLLLVGIVGNGVPSLMFTIGQTEVSSALAGILNSLTPLFTLIVAVAVFKVRASWRNVLGVVIGLAGAVGLIVYGEGLFFSGNLWYSMFIVVAAFCYAISSNVIKEKLANLSGIAVTALAFLMVGPWAGAYLAFSDLPAAFVDLEDWRNFGSIMLLAFFSSFFAVTLFYSLIKHTTTIFATSVTYIIPVFAIVWGILDGEKFQFFQFLWIIVILAGVYLVNTKAKNKKHEKVDKN